MGLYNDSSNFPIYDYTKKTKVNPELFLAMNTKEKSVPCLDFPFNEIIIVSE